MVKGEIVNGPRVKRVGNISFIIHPKKISVQSSSQLFDKPASKDYTQNTVLELPHAIVGATIAIKTGNPFLAFPLAFLSNFILDILPHWNPHLYTELKRDGKVSSKTMKIVFIDAFLALIIGLFLAFRFYPDWTMIILILLSCFLAVSTDLAEAPFFFLNSKNKFLVKLISIQRKLQWNVSFWPGMLVQGGLLLFCFYLIFFT